MPLHAIRTALLHLPCNMTMNSNMKELNLNEMEQVNGDTIGLVCGIGYILSAQHLLLGFLLLSGLSPVAKGRSIG